MMSKTKALAMIFTGVFLLSSLQALQAQSDSYEEPAVRTTSSRISTASKPAVRPTTTRTAASRLTPARPVVDPRPASIRRTTSSRTTSVGRGSPGMEYGGRGGPIRPQVDLIASGLLKVVCDDSILELNDQILGAIVNSSFVLSQEAQEELTIEVHSLGKTREQNLFQLTIFEIREPEDEGEEEGEKGEKEAPPGAGKTEGEGDDFLELPPAEMINVITNRLREILMAEFDKQRNQYRGKLEDAEVYLKPLEDKMRRLNDLERELFAKAGMSSLRREDVLSQIRSLERQKQDMEMRLVEAAAREDALQKQIAILSDQTKKKLSQDAVLRELEHIVKLREQEMITVQKMVEAGQASQNEYFKVREGIAQARIKLVERQEAIRESLGGGATMQERVKELTDIAISHAMDQAVLKHIAEQLEMLKAKKILELADQYEVEIALKQNAIRQSYEYTQESIQGYRLHMQRLLVPSVSVLGGD